MNKQETIEKLSELNVLLDEFTEEIVKTENGGLAEKYINIFHAIKAKTGALPGVPSVFSNLPNYNYKYYDIGGLEKQKNDILKKSAILAIASLVCFLISRISYKLMTFMYIAVILFFVVIYLGNKVNKVAKEYNEKKATNDETKQRQDNEEHAFLESLKNFEEEKLKGMNMALDYKHKVFESFNECEREMENYLKESEESKQRQYELTDQIKEYDFVPPEYFHYVPAVLTLLKSGRADDYKEALNIAIAEEKDAEERAQRMEEDRRRTMIMEQQAEEERRHNRMMEEEQATANRIQAEHNKAMQDAERKRIYNQERAEKQAVEAQHRARSMSTRRCNACKKVGHCNMSHSGMENCAAFEPR